MCCLSQWAKVIMMLERTYSAEELTLYQRDYSIAFDANVSSDTRGLTVIKRTSVTSADRRRRALANWRV